MKDWVELMCGLDTQIMALYKDSISVFVADSDEVLQFLQIQSSVFVNVFRLSLIFLSLRLEEIVLTLNCL